MPKSDTGSELYLKFRAFGGTYAMKTVAQLDFYMTIDCNRNVNGTKSWTSTSVLVIKWYFSHPDQSITNLVFVHGRQFWR